MTLRQLFFEALWLKRRRKSTGSWARTQLKEPRVKQKIAVSTSNLASWQLYDSRFQLTDCFRGGKWFRGHCVVQKNSEQERRAVRLREYGSERAI